MVYQYESKDVYIAYLFATGLLYRKTNAMHSPDHDKPK